MEQSEKEKQFAIEYKALLDKYNVKLVLSPCHDDYGRHIDLSFKEHGKYCNINYSPDFIEEPDKCCSMGQ